MPGANPGPQYARLICLTGGEGLPLRRCCEGGGQPLISLLRAGCKDVDGRDERGHNTSGRDERGRDTWGGGGD
jgi:hypothetical protein